MDFLDLAPDCDRFTISAPGNLLLSGEYAVTEAGGSGIWLAPELRAWLYCRPAPALSISGRWPGGGLSWTARDGEEAPPLLQAVLDGLQQLVQAGLLPSMPSIKAELELDTSAFFASDGRKWGYGSSAASCLVLSAACFQLASAGLTSAQRQTIIPHFSQWAVENHRRFQGGRGSGYDVLASFHGGLGIFTGGPVPNGSRLDDTLAQLFPPYRISAGPAAVRTTSAITSWQRWGEQHPAEKARIISRSREISTALAASQSRDELRAKLEESRILGLEIGQAIGVPASIPGSNAADCWFRKALGAGNETIIEFLTGENSDAGAIHKDFPGIASRGLEARRISHQASARGKLLLFGEHVALYGWPALGTPLDCATTIHFCPTTPSAPPSANSRFPGLSDQLAVLASQVLDRAAEAYPGIRLPDGEFRIDSSVPLGSGFGSSAAFCAALARLMSDWAADQRCSLRPTWGDPAEAALWRLANHLDGLFHGKASGIDAGLSLAAGPLAFLPEPAAPLGFHTRALLPVAGDNPDSSAERWIVYCAVARQGNTRNLVAGIREGMERQDPRIVHGIAALGQASQQAIDLIRGNGSAADLGHLANQVQGLLGNLGLSSPELELVLTLGRAAGACGGKLSGAGGGGACYFWAASREQAQAVASALAAAHKDSSSGICLTVQPALFRLTNAGSAGSDWSGRTPAA